MQESASILRAGSASDDSVLAHVILRGVRLFSIKVIVEATDEEDADTVAEAIARAICPHPAESDHACPRGWITMKHELDENEAAVWGAPDALNR
jgi:hypothetical protein